MQPSKCYDPADINSSPYEPMIGQIVLFQPIRNGSIGRQKWPAMITNVCGTPDDRVDLTVFTVTGIIHVSRVPFSGDATRENVWHYMAEPTKRSLRGSNSSAQAATGIQTGAELDPAPVV